MAEPIQIGILLYPNVTQLDATGPAQVLSRVPGRQAAHGLEDARSGADRRRLLDRADDELRRLPAARRASACRAAAARSS